MLDELGGGTKMKTSSLLGEWHDRQTGDLFTDYDFGQPAGRVAERSRAYAPSGAAAEGSPAGVSTLKRVAFTSHLLRGGIKSDVAKLHGAVGAVEKAFYSENENTLKGFARLD